SSFYRPPTPPSLHSFPTRRSSDLLLELDLAHALPELVPGLDDVEQQDASARVHDAAGGVEERALHLRRLVHDHHQLAAVARLEDASFLGHASCYDGIPPPTIDEV